MKKKINNSGYTEVLGTVIMILSSCFFISGILIAILSH